MTDVAPVKRTPVMVTNVPTGPDAGDTAVIAGSSVAKVAAMEWLEVTSLKVHDDCGVSATPSTVSVSRW